MSDKVFDWHDWNYKVVRTPEEVLGVLKSFHIPGKRISAVHAIGITCNTDLWRNVDSILESAGIPPDVISNSYPYMDGVLLPVEAELCEPVVIEFEDGTTLELQAHYGKELRVSVNEIGADVRDGTNHSNFYSEALFSGLSGHGIRDVAYYLRRTEHSSTRSSGIESREAILWHFALDGDRGFSIRSDAIYDSWYRFGITDQHQFAEFGYASARCTLREWRNILRPIRQVEIIEGHDSSSYFWIMPVRQAEQSREAPWGVIEYRAEEISIEELDVNDYLRDYLEKYFDPDFPYTCRFEDSEPGFEWYLEYNLYTYETMRKMLDEMEKDAEQIAAGTELSQSDMVRIDFYRRFIYRMRRMMENALEYDLISFMGP